MAQTKFRANLSAANIPYVSDFFSRSIIIPQIDMNSPKVRGFDGTDGDLDIGIPQAFYCHNVMPTGQGLMAIGFQQKIPPLSGADDFDQYMLLRDADENKFLYSPANGKNYIYRGDTQVWASTNPLIPGSFAGTITKAYLHARTFVFYANLNCYEYNTATGVFGVASLTSLVSANILGLCAAINYLIAYDEETIYWGSPLVGSETDFTPSTLVGSGSTQIQEVRGKIVAVLPISGGFMVYTTNNVVKAQYSGNLQAPWVFSEVAGSAGIASIEHVAYESNFSVHYAWTTAGLMRIEKAGAELVFPEATDFLAGYIFEDCDPSTLLLAVQYLGSKLNIKVSVAGNRYVIVSYGITVGAYTHALIFDIALKRFGKVRLTHVDAFEFVQPNFFGVRSYAQLTPNTYAELSPTTYTGLSLQQETFVQPGKSIGFLQQNGAVQIINFQPGAVAAEGVLFIGKFQLQRSRFLQLTELEVESLFNNPTNFTVAICTSYDGKNFGLIIPATQIYSSGTLRKYGSRQKGENITLRFTGSFYLVYLGLAVTVEGNR